MPKENSFNHEFFKNHFETVFVKTFKGGMLMKITLFENEKGIVMIKHDEKTFSTTNMYTCQEHEYEAAQSKICLSWINQSSNYDGIRAKNKQEVEDMIKKIS